MKHEKILVAGVAGFLGSYLAESLIQSGIKVVGVDNWITGSKKSIEHLLSDPSFDFIELNINQRLPETFFKEAWSAIVHVANVEAFSIPKRLELNELLTNSFGVKNLLDLALHTKARFVLTSTIDIYQGLASHTDLTRYYQNVEQQSVLTLSEAKRYAEALCQEYVSLYGLDVRVARLAEVYGPRMNLAADSIIAQVMSAALEGRNLVLDDVGSRVVYTTFYSDVVFGLNKLILSDGEKLKGGIFYLVNKEPVSLLSLVLTIKEYAPHNITVEFLPRVKEPLFDAPTVDVGRSRNELYWEAKVSLQEGIKKTMVHYLADKSLIRPEPDVIPIQQKQEEPLKKKEEKPVEATLEETEALTIEHVEERIPEEPPVEEVQEEIVPKEDPQPTAVPDAEPTKPSRGWLKLKEAVPPKKEAQSVQIPYKAPHWLVNLMAATAVFLAAWFIFLPITGIAFHGVAAYTQVQRVKESLNLSDYQKAEDTLENLAGSVQQIGSYWGRTEWFWQLIQKKHLYHTVTQWTAITYETAKAGQYGIAFVETLQPWWKPLTLGKDEGSFAEQRSQSRIALSQSEWRLFRQHMTVAERLTHVASLQEVPIFTESVLGVIDRIRQMEEITRIDANAWQHFPQWLGYEGPQHIALLLQNSAEVRATGGFIGSYALISINNGVMGALQVNDIYDPDGQLAQLENVEGLLAAPQPIQDHLAAGPLTLRDSNWWPDFPTSAAAFAQLFPLATEVELDWVMAVNLQTIVELLRTLGPLTLPVTGQTVTADNFFEKAQTASERDFEPGSSGKKDFLGEVTQQMWLSLFPMDGTKLSSVGVVVFDQLGTGQIKAFSTHPEWNGTIAESSITGSMLSPAGDYISVVSSNVGHNKSNHWVTRSTSYSVFVDRDASMRSKLEIQFVHDGESETWPNGPYRDYLRIYVPVGAQVRESTGFTGNHITYHEENKLVIAGLVDVALDSSKTVSVTYTLPEQAMFGEDDTYSLFVQGQAGIVDEPFAFSMQLPFFMDYMSTEPGVTIDAEKVVRWQKALRNYNGFSLTVSQQQ